MNGSILGSANVLTQHGYGSYWEIYLIYNSVLRLSNRTKPKLGAPMWSAL